MTNRTGGFTLIELVAALVLASLLTAGLLQIVTVVARESNQLRGELSDPVAAGRLADRLRTDLINARGIRADQNAILMAGFSSDTQLPSNVRYERTTIGSRPVLVRVTDRQRELCWVGFGGFDFQPFDQVDQQTPVPDAAGGLPAIPSQFQLQAIDDTGRVLLSEVIVHHAN
ncbi:prepilin-type N-terminal cleavage/methylation domain-containing protein [Stieleria sp. TO1_6]|uniref:PulJ/GspJ family protein n=1 Tax=Stieleria tagensis TaxID=2956795 RepID=UPI00209AC5AD|nr:prepilin-type N-terminal cleavage/methylation domain-containing protein [Stieleria tagensis]MCO8121764.1 prepilin-type N-terminal cleavage/methylation domain-containing protein [Stieleria tagensis]